MREPSPGDSRPHILLMPGDEGLPGRLALSWSMAGGLGVVAALVAAASLSGSLDAGSVPFSATLFFLIGALGGFVHGSVVGVAGRAPEVSLTQAIRAILIGAGWAFPALAAAWTCGLWISMTSAAASASSPGLLIVVAAGWLVFVAVSGWAAIEARSGLHHAMARWPERRPGVALVLLIFPSLLAIFVWTRPEIWFTDLRVSALGAVFLAVGATLWIALPILVVTLHFLHRWSSESAIWEGNDLVHGKDFF